MSICVIYRSIKLGFRSTTFKSNSKALYTRQRPISTTHGATWIPGEDNNRWLKVHILFSAQIFWFWLWTIHERSDMNYTDLNDLRSIRTKDSSPEHFIRRYINDQFHDCFLLSPAKIKLKHSNFFWRILCNQIHLPVQSLMINLSSSHNRFARLGVSRKVYTYLEMMFFMGLNEETNTNISFLACFTACSSVKPTTDRGGWLPEVPQVSFLLNSTYRKNDYNLV